MSTHKRTYLEMACPAQLRAKIAADAGFRVGEARVKDWRFNRFLYCLVGEAWMWRDKLSWSAGQWQAYAEADNLRTFAAYMDGAPAGYFELSLEKDAVEIAIFGLSPKFIGRGLGGPLLTRAIEEAWGLGAARVWLHTCSLDHPAALQNYLSRGMVIVRTEGYEWEPAIGEGNTAGGSAA